MLTSITPLGERGRANRWSVTIAAYIVGSLAAGAALGAALGALGGWVAPVGRAALGLLAVAAFGACALDLAGRRPWCWHRQVDENWLHAFRGWVYGAGYGLQLGAGVLTIVTTGTVYLVWWACWLTGSAPAAALLGGAFGLSRAIPLVAVRGVRSPGALRDLSRKVAVALGPARVITATGSAGVGVAAAVLALGAGR
jgi:hypothetical protein